MPLRLMREAAPLVMNWWTVRPFFW